jgi:2-hydroxychromene-2-carboxylate isomerase
LIGHDEGWGVAFSKKVYQAEFGSGSNISSPEVMAPLLREVGQGPERLFALAGDAAIKARLRERTEEAQELEIFGAPSFLAGGELFWGDDRLEAALAHARAAASAK